MCLRFYPANIPLAHRGRTRFGRVLLTAAIEGGWGLAGHANTNAELVDAARAQIAQITAAKDGGQK
jgi:hypothetical protein